MTVNLLAGRARAGRAVIATALAALVAVFAPLHAVGVAAFAASDSIQRLDGFALELGEDSPYGATLDPAGRFAYFGLASRPSAAGAAVDRGAIIKVDLDNFSRVGALTLEPGENQFIARGLMDPRGAFAYFVTGERDGGNPRPAVVVKIDLHTFTRVGAITLETDEGGVSSALIGPDGEFAYFGTAGTSTDPARVVKVKLGGATCVGGAVCGGMERVGAVEMNAGEKNIQSGVIDPSGAFAYFGTEAGEVLKVRLDGATCAVSTVCGGMERIAGLSLEPGETFIASAAIDPAGAFAYFFSLFGPIVRINLVTFSRDTVLTLDNSIYGQFISLGAAAISPDGAHLYVSHNSGGQVVQIDVATFAPVGVATPDSGEGTPRHLLITPDSATLITGTDNARPGRILKFQLVLGSGTSTGTDPAASLVAPSFVAPGGVLPALPAGVGAWVQADGSSEPLAVSSPGVNQLRYAADGVEVTFTGGSGSSVSRGLVADANGEVVCEVCLQLAAGQVIEVWMFSTPRLVAAHLTEDLPCQRFSVPVVAPLDGGGPVVAGAHTLQLALPTASGMQAVNVGVTVGGPVPASVPAGEGSMPFGAVLFVLLGAAGVLVAGRRLVTAG